MASNSSIEWTEATWNPVTGCDKVSAGCKNCYAERMSRRLKAMGKLQYRNGFKVTLQPGALNIPLGWRSPKVIFVNSMSDLFHKDVPLAYIQQVFSVMNATPQHTYQILTKRPENVLRYDTDLIWSPNIWLGTSVENQKVAHRIRELKRSSAKTKFLSLEPLIGPLRSLPLSGIDWVIVGGESGPGARTMEAEWVRDIRKQCKARKIPFFFKQWGGPVKSRTGRTLDGRTWDEMPAYEKRQSAARLAR